MQKYVGQCCRYLTQCPLQEVLNRVGPCTEQSCFSMACLARRIDRFEMRFNSHQVHRNTVIVGIRVVV